MRPAVREDAGTIAQVRLACWREAYAHLLSEELLLAQEQRHAEDTAMWEGVVDAGRPVVVAEVGGEVVGLVATFDHRDRTGPVRRPADEHRPADLELCLLYLLAARHGSGLGQALLDAAIGDRACFLWVAEDNPRAQAFYARNGFRPDGVRYVETKWEDLVEVRLVRGAA